MNEPEISQFVATRRRTRASWQSIGDALVALDVTPQELYLHPIPSYDDVDKIHATLVRRFANRHGID